MRFLLKFVICVLLWTSVVHAAEMPSLQEPLQVKEASMYLDGGTIVIILIDSTGHEFTFCLDGRMKAVSMWQAITHQYPKRHLYINARHPSIAGAKELALGSGEEKAILKMLQSLMDSKYSKDQQKEILKSPGTDENSKDQLVIRVIEILEER